MDEFALIKRLVQLLPHPSSRVEVGIGDDAAVCQISPGCSLVTSIDMMVEGRHFTTQAIPGRAVGYKLIAAGVSDLAAMGAVPRYACISVAVPSADANCSYLEEVYRGIAQACRKWGVDVVSGDTTAAQQIVLDACLIGEARAALTFRRSTARTGELIAVTGTIGDAAAGLSILQAETGIVGEVAASLIERHCYPDPPVLFAAELAEQQLIGSCNDISDGLASELHEICEASQVGASIEADKLPLSVEVLQAAASREQARNWALFGGEDYQLVFTVKPDSWQAVLQIARKHAVKVHCIGKITAEKCVAISHSTGKQLLPKGGFNHFGW